MSSFLVNSHDEFDFHKPKTASRNLIYSIYGRVVKPAIGVGINLGQLSPHNLPACLEGAMGTIFKDANGYVLAMNMGIAIRGRIKKR
ncbi:MULTISPECIES: hypothetical protein [unclassified Paenibacillus]|uniref:hypothetical protein n=1 Tax=unclassified Paenibacillus TaxID=185978 RepID=UPI0007096E74|nr:MULTISPECIES: hypothetical protein [unclassified Paenibacillus]KQX48551.1 hypothetical protein ASD40_10170 [Paenibacillus sp. Root444D2]KRE49829.1 hypothetical protein ASG85_23440 [Paenibacillus sp. Soil724D2]